MIRAHFLYSGGRAVGFEVLGHAGYAQAGSDIVCAGVSSAVQMAANTITEVMGVSADVRDVGGKITVLLPQGSGSEKTAAAQDVITGLRLQLSVLSEQFESTISFEDSEV